MTIIAIAAAPALGFANGANDNAKGVATLIGGGSVPTRRALQYAAGTTLLGSRAATLLAGALVARRVARTISHRITDRNDGQAFTANLATALRVILTLRFDVPFSTRHVSCGSLFGIGMVNGGHTGG